MSVRRRPVVTWLPARRWRGLRDRVLWPLGLFFSGTNWTLAAWCELRGDSRNFRLDRILDLTVTDEVFPITPAAA